MSYISYADKILGFLAFISFITYISLVSSDRYVNRNSPAWVSLPVNDKKYVGYTNMVGNLSMIFTCGLDNIIFFNNKKIYLGVYIGKLIILMLFIGLTYDITVDNSSYGKFNAALQPLVGYLQILSIGTIVQITTRIDLNLHKNIKLSSDEERTTSSFANSWLENKEDAPLESEVVYPEKGDIDYVEEDEDLLKEE
jgi:hypothetical protein